MSSRVDELLKKYGGTPGSNSLGRASRIGQDTNQVNRISDYMRPAENKVSNYQNYASEYLPNKPQIQTFGDQDFKSDYYNKPAENLDIKSTYSRKSYNQTQPAANNYNPQISINNVRENFDLGNYKGVQQNITEYKPPTSSYTTNIATSKVTTYSGYNPTPVVENRAIAPSNSSSTNLDSFVQMILMGAEVQRLNETSSHYRPTEQRVQDVNDDPLFHENNRLREALRERDFKFQDFKSENQRIKDREEKLKQSLNELNEENKRLMSLQQFKNKGPWCC